MSEFQGKTEFDIFKNFSSKCGNVIRTIAETLKVSCKNDIKSDRIRKSVIEQYRAKNYYYCLENYTKSLRYATYNGLQYSLALANRSATYFDMQLYENCLIDIGLCFQADYPNDKRPKLYFRKIKCLANMGKFEDMLQTFDACSTFLSDTPNISEPERQKYLKEIKSFVEDVRCKDFKPAVSLGEISFMADQVIEEPHEENASASCALSFQCGNGDSSDMTISAARNIKRGEVLFLEKAYVVGIHYTLFGDGYGAFYCDCCSKEARNCVPCKICIGILYCSEKCRDTSWSECHQWECKMFRSDFLQPGVYLALRSVIKAASTGSINEITNKSPANIKTPNHFLKIYKYSVNYNVLRRDHQDTLLHACTASVYMVQALQSLKYFDFLMTTPYYTNYENIASLVPVIGGILLKHIVQSVQKALCVNRFSPIITSLNDNQVTFKLSDMNIKSNTAFCPSVSGLPHSCLSNTSISFQQDICTVKACKDIKAGDLIYRSACHLKPANNFQDRKVLMINLALTCKCEACLNIRNNYDNFDTFLCPLCGGRATVNFESLLTECVDCTGHTKLLGVIQARFADFKSWFREDDIPNMSVPTTLKALTSLNLIAHPYHILIQDLHKHLVLLYRKTGNIKKFFEASKKYKEIAEKRTAADPFQYLLDLSVMCENCFQFLYNNKGKLQKREALELINYFTDLMEETKEVISLEDPSLVNMFIPTDRYLIQLKMDYLQLEDV